MNITKYKHFRKQSEKSILNIENTKILNKISERIIVD